MLINCFLVDQIRTENMKPYYHYAFGELGFSMGYVDDTNNLLIGAPGVDSWSGRIHQI